jgi:hypothetical protein
VLGARKPETTNAMAATPGGAAIFNRVASPSGPWRCRPEITRSRSSWWLSVFSVGVTAALAVLDRGLSR